MFVCIVHVENTNRMNKFTNDNTNMHEYILIGSIEHVDKFTSCTCIRTCSRFLCTPNNNSNNNCSLWAFDLCFLFDCFIERERATLNLRDHLFDKPHLLTGSTVYTFIHQYLHLQTYDIVFLPIKVKRWDVSIQPIWLFEPLRHFRLWLKLK